MIVDLKISYLSFVVQYTRIYTYANFGGRPVVRVPPIPLYYREYTYCTV